jgi:hypothetical protein
LIRAENEKRDRDFALLRAEFAAFRGLVDLKLDTVLSMLSTHTAILYQMNERGLAAPARRRAWNRIATEAPWDIALRGTSAPAFSSS